ncbi:hypothetical protein HMPREF3192_00362 [Atopobium deltae]|uniref:Uncharacterized protein n=2 Tax=Atopobium deltae TaxID=1393034 RepID=A0A133XWH1_9ACTN|nr:hypothetical protein HMPREF3192_00362 [Atopobium deltae]
MVMNADKNNTMDNNTATKMNADMCSDITTENFMKKHGISDADLERMAAPYEEGEGVDLDPEGVVYVGSHLETVEKQ